MLQLLLLSLHLGLFLLALDELIGKTPLQIVQNLIVVLNGLISVSFLHELLCILILLDTLLHDLIQQLYFLLSQTLL